MAVDICSDISSSAASPRISFSHYLNQDDYDRLPQCAPPSPFSDDFEFPVGKHACATADDVFSGGRILPPIQKEGGGPGLPPAPVPGSERNKEMAWAELEEKERGGGGSGSTSSSRHFWRIGRSASVNGSGRNRGGRGLLRSLQFLSRSKSTGSATGGNKEEDQKRCMRKQTTPVHSSSWQQQQKRPARKSCRHKGGEGVRVMPVLNISPQCISKASAGLFRPLMCGGGGGKEVKRK